MVFEDHRFRRRFARGVEGARRVAGEGPADAGELDRQEPRAAVQLPPGRAGRGNRFGRGVHDPARHHLRRELRRRCRRSSDRAGGGSGGFGRRRVHRRVQGRRDQRRRDRNRREEGIPYRDRGRPPARSGPTPARLHRELRADGLWHRRDFRRSRSRPARLRVCEAISSIDQAGRCGKRRCRCRAHRR